jgi:type II secretory pathway pseudopilin PulG
VITSPLRALRTVAFVRSGSAAGTEAGANLLANNILGIVVGLIFIVAGISALLISVNSAKGARAKDIMANEIAAQVHAYYLSNQQFPGGSSWSDVVSVMGTSSFPATPCDPLDKSCTTASSTSDFTIQSTATDYALRDTFAHPTGDLANLPQFQAVGTQPSGTCSTSCTNYYWDAIYGIQGGT